MVKHNDNFCCKRCLGLAACFADELAAVHVDNEQLGKLINTAPIPGLAAAERNFG